MQVQIKDHTIQMENKKYHRKMKKKNQILQHWHKKMGNYFRYIVCDALYLTFNYVGRHIIIR